MGRLAALLCLVAATLSGCGAGKTGTGTVKTNHRPVSITVGMGYFADVQFAPFYVAQARGYYRKAGLNVHFHYGIEPNLLRLASVGKFDFVNAGGDEVLAAGAQGLGVTYVMTQYSRFPSAIVSPRSKGIRNPAALRGHSIGVPGLYGASYVGLLALLQRAHVPVSDVSIKNIGFTQVAAISQHKIDAAVVYAMNEPVELRSERVAINELDIYHQADLAGAGLAARNSLIRQHPAAVRAFVQATLHGLRDTLRNPSAAFRISENAVKTIKAQPTLQRAILMRSLDFWRPEAGHPLGWVDSRIWSLTARDLYAFHQISRSVSATPYYTNRFVSGS
jgi:NitT/TauT family transport system substrate-binding protein